MAQPIHPEMVPEGFVPATHGGPYAKELGPFWSKPETAQVTLGLRLQHRHCNSACAAHGGFLATLADLGLIHAVSVMCERDGRPRHHLTTVTLTVDYVAPAKEGCWLEVRAEVSPRHRQVVASRWTELVGPRTMLAWSSSCRSNPADIGPYLERMRPCGAVLAGGDAVAAEVEEVVDLVMGGEEALCLPRRLEPLHLPFSSSRRLV